MFNVFFYLQLNAQIETCSIHDTVKVLQCIFSPFNYCIHCNISQILLFKIYIHTYHNCL